MLFDRVLDNSGAPLNDVACILRDHTGFMWFGTIDGLYRYDGRNLLVFRNDPNDSTTISASRIAQLAEDSTGHLLISTAGGLCRYEERTRSFTRIYPTHPVSLEQAWTSALYVDANNHIWFTNVAGLNEYIPATGQITTYAIFEPVPPKLRFITSHTVSAIHERKGILWMTTGQGLCRFDKTNRNWTYYRNPTGTPADSTNGLYNSMQQFMFDKDGSLWLGCWGDGLVHFDPATGTFEHHLLTDQVKIPGTENIVIGVCPDQFFGDTNRLWISTVDRGLAMFDKRRKQFSYFGWTLSERPDSIFGSYTFALCDDNHGTFWVGAASGVYKINRFRQRFRQKSFVPYSNNPQKPDITCFAEDSARGVIYLGSFGSGMGTWNRATDSISHIPGLDYSVTGYINQIKKGPDGWYYVCGEKNFMRYEPAHRTVEKIVLPDSIGYLSNVIDAGNGKFWVTSYAKGVFLYDLVSKTVIPVITAKQLPASSKPGIHALLCTFSDGAGNLWVGTKDRGVLRYRVSDGAMHIYSHFGTKMGNTFYNVSVIRQEDDGTIWAGSDQGLLRFGKTDTTFRLFTTADGLPSNFIYHLVFDRMGKLWLSTNRGLCQMDTKKNTFRIFTRKDGLNWDGLYNESVLLSDGSIILAGDKGFVYFDPVKFTLNLQAPPVLFTSVKLMGNETGFLLPDTAVVHTFSHDQNQLQFEFAALSYIFPERNRYAYKLENIDADWVYTDNTHNSASYSSLPPGRYVFHVKACNNDGIWNEKGIRYVFRILPPFWATWWFRLLAVLVIALIIYGIYRYRIAQILRVERMRNKIAGDLHDDIGSALSSISISSAIGKQQAANNETVQRTLNDIGETSRSMIDNMGDIVWSINPKNDRFDQVLSRMRHFGEALLSPLGVTFSFEANIDNQQLRLTMEQRKELYLFFKEAIHNIAKHAQAKTVIVNIHLDGRLLDLNVSDDGRGFTPGNGSNGNGLQTMKRRAAALKGTLTIDSATGTGTRLHLQFKAT